MNPIELGLPHRKPFLFVDEVADLNPGVSASGTVRFDSDNAMFAGHFPGNPIVPGVILTEALAQLAGVAAADADRQFLLSALRSMKFPGPARPGEEIVLRADKAGEMAGLLQFDVEAKVGDRMVANGTVVLSEAA